MKQSRKTSEHEPVQGTLVQVARLYYDNNLSQQEIATRLGISRSLVALYLQQAREAGVVRIQIVDLQSASTELEVALRKATGVKHITVIPNPHGSPMLALRAVAEATAGFLANTLRDGDAFGLAWGRTTSEVVELLNPSHALRVDVIPLMGECGLSGMHSQMNQLVMQAAQRLSATPHFLSLPMVVSTPELRNALVKEVGIRDVIERWDRINLACVGIGVVPPVPGMVVYIGDEQLPRLIKAGAVGDLCGIYYDREGQIIKSGLESRLISAGIKQMKAMDNLVVVACGEEKAVAVLGALRTGLISTLFIDQKMAERILAGLQAAGAQKR